MTTDKADAEAVSAEDATQLDRGLVTIKLGDALFAADVTSVIEVFAIREIIPLFRLPAHIRGIINLRGRILPVADLATLLGLPARAAATGLLLRWQNREALFAVDEVSSVQWVSSRSIVDVPSTTPEAARKFFQGVYRGAEPATVLSTPNLFADGVWLTLAEGGTANP